MANDPEEYLLGQVLSEPHVFAVLSRQVKRRDIRLVCESCVEVAAAGQPLTSEAIGACLRARYPGEPIADQSYLHVLLREAMITYMADRPRGVADV